MTSKLEKIKELNQLAWDLCMKDSPKALELANQAQALLSDCAEAQPVDEFECLKIQAYCLDMFNKPEQALPIGLRANELAEQIGDKYQIGSIQSILGRTYWHIDDFATSLSFYLNALKLVQTENHPKLEITLINGLGLVQYGLENYAESLGYFRSCLEKASEDDLMNRGYAYNNIAYVLHVLGRDQEALEFGAEGLVLFNQTGSYVIGKMENLHTLGAIHRALGNYDQALTLLEQGLEISRQNNSQLLELTYVMEIGHVHQLQGQLDLAEAEMLQALQAAEKINSLTNIALAHERLVEINKERQDYKSALDHYEVLYATNKKIFNDKSDRRIKNLEILHQVEIARKQADLYRELAGTDFLTSIANRRRFLEIVETTCQQAEINRRQLAILMLDIDHFKNVNDLNGHKVGDKVLSVVAACIKKSLRQSDVVGRYGGEEFIVLVTDSTEEQCVKLAERTRQAVADEAIQIEQTKIQVTISVGVAWLDLDEAFDSGALINRADQAMYRAKQQGRNRVVAWTPTAQAIGARTNEESLVISR